MFDIITFGSASQDVYLKSKAFLPVAGKIFTTGKGICLPLGSKIEVENIFFTSGGGGTNTAATFAHQGFKVAYCGMVGQDNFGHLIIKELKRINISTDLIKQTKNKPTTLSLILMYPGQDRTILVYRGASDVLKKSDIPWSELKNTKWFYLAPFSGVLADSTEDLVDFAKSYQIKVAFNPGYNQLTLPRPVLARILKKVDILILNREEAALLAKIPYQKEKAIFKKIDRLVAGISIMTKGGEGVTVSDGQNLYYAQSLGMKMVDGTGAGDAFGSGFVSGMMEKVKEDKSSFSPSANDIVYAIQLAMANSGSCITQLGAKEGLLKKGKKWPKVTVEKKPL